MTTLLTFIIPVRHQDNARDWNKLCDNLRQTMASISGQQHAGWRAVVVANEGAQLPPMPDGFSVEHVNFPPNDLHEITAANKQSVYDAFRFDKGRRVLRGMLSARDTKFFMIVDDDDFVSAHLTGYVARHCDMNGWKVEKGFVWGDGGRLLYKHNDFANFCGTSLLVRADLYDLPDRFEDADEDYIKTMLGSHVQIGRILAQRGTPLAPLPFRGAVYRIGHRGAHSKSPGLAGMYFFNWGSVRQPHRILINLKRLRYLDRRRRAEFFGA
ncbi:hypothetical protein [Sphingobium sp.]|uniref:hypothetical protein n=1 Tax=Sphingobium sp. TaxID=1912891 RepID=UPI003B3B3666